MKRHLNHSPARRRASQRGSILVICLAMAAVGTLGTAAYLSLIQAKSEEGEQRQRSLERRAREANSLSLAKEVIYRKYVDAPSGPTASETHKLPGGWGEATIAPFTQSPIDSTASTRLHKTGAVPSTAFATDIAVSLNDGDTKHPWQVQVKTANPAQTGDLLVFHEPTVAEADRIITEKIRVKGRSVVWLGGTKDQIELTTAKAFVVDPSAPDKLELWNLAGAPLKPQNFPFMPTTEGRIKGESIAAYDGRISVVDNTDLSTPSYTELIAAQPATSVTTVDGRVQSPAFTTDPIVLNIPDGSKISDVDDDDGGGYVTGGYSPAVYSVIRQALEAYVRTHAAAYKALATGTKIKYSYKHLKPDLPAFSTWHSNEKEFDGSKGLVGVTSDLISAASQVTSDLDSAMQSLGGPNVYLGGWWAPILPLPTSAYFTVNNPYPNGTWENAPAGSDGDGQVRINLTTSNHVRITNNAEVLVLEGRPNQAAADAAALMEPLLIVITNKSDSELKLEDIVLKGVNQRPIILAMKQEYDPANVAAAKAAGKGRGNPASGEGGKGVTAKEIDVTFEKGTMPNFPTWRMLMELENTPLKMKVGGVGKSATIVGGIRTDASLKGDGGEVTIEADPNLPATAKQLGRRYAWLETFRN